MFQNLADEKEEVESKEEDATIQKSDKNEKFKEFKSKLLTKQNILMYILSLMISMVSGPNGMAPFGLAIFAACISNEMPGSVIFLMTLIGTGIGFGTSGVFTYIFTVLAFIALVLIFKPWYEPEYKSERRKLGKYVFGAVTLVQIIQMLFRGFLLYDLFLSVTTGIVTYIFYKIFANSLITISEFGIKKAFTVEEVIGTSLMLAITASCFGELSILGFEIRTVLCILIVLILGWKNGMLIRSNIRYSHRYNHWYNRWRRTNITCCICTFRIDFWRFE